MDKAINLVPHDVDTGTDSDSDSLPFRLVQLPMDDDRESAYPPSVYRLSRVGGEWVINSSEKKILWIPSDNRGKFEILGRRAVFGNDSGIISATRPIRVVSNHFFCDMIRFLIHHPVL
jgi:hypothetical protein